MNQFGVRVAVFANATPEQILRHTLVGLQTTVGIAKFFRQFSFTAIGAGGLVVNTLVADRPAREARQVIQFSNKQFRIYSRKGILE
jgi:hypothetical protein